MSGSLRESLSKIPLQKLLIEVFSIVVGVLLALAMNEWRENRANRALAQTALANVESEIRSNQELLVRVNEINKSALELIEQVDREDEETKAFVPGLQLQEIAWTALLSSGVSSHIDYQMLLGLSECYAIQRVYKDMGRQIVQAELSSAAYAAAAGTTVDDQNKIENFAGFFGLLVAIEAQLLSSYEETLAMFEGP